MDTEVVPLRSIDDPSITRMRLERFPSGHVASPWFSVEGIPSAESGDRYGQYGIYQVIRNCARCALAIATNLGENDIFITERPSGEFRVVTRRPVAMPKAATVAKLASEMSGAIDV